MCLITRFLFNYTRNEILAGADNAFMHFHLSFNKKCLFFKLFAVISQSGPNNITQKAVCTKHGVKFNRYEREWKVEEKSAGEL